MTATVTKLKPEQRKPCVPVVRKPKGWLAKVRTIAPRKLAAYGIIGVDTLLLGLSLSHLAHGTQLVTKCEVTDAWLMALGIDAGFVALEYAGLAAPDLSKSLWLKVPIGWCLGISAVMNAVAFTERADGLLMQVGAVMLGVTIPALIFAGTHLVAKLLGRKG